MNKKHQANDSTVLLELAYVVNGLWHLRNNFLTRELLLINTGCWRADQEILIHDGASRSELIFISARQHVLISDNLPVRRSYFDSNII